MKTIISLVLFMFILTAAPAFAAHSVSLTCTLPSDFGSGSVINFYRGTAAGAEGATPINSAGVTTCAFTDVNVSPGATYFYTAKQVVSGNTSVPSNEAPCTVLPFAPVSLQAISN